MKLVVVESPAKSKTIGKYLGKDYKVLASYGHICDLPSKNGSVLPDQDFLMKYEVSSRSEKYVKDLCDVASKSDEIVLATDPDREGEAISWHVLEVIRERVALPSDIKVSRVVFNEITKKSVQEAFKSPRDIDMDLVNAQQARRALDYLVGFTLSPVLWRKLPGARSAGRVQSVALRLISDREKEIEAFISREYWDVTGHLTTSNGEKFSARLTHFVNDSKIQSSDAQSMLKATKSEAYKLEKFSIPNKDAAETIVAKFTNNVFTIADIENKRSKRNPAAPFTTSTLQQEAARKLGFSAKKTMQIAQKLYEGVKVGSETTGLITYMRTDGVYIAKEAIDQIRDHIGTHLGDKYLPNAPREYKSKAKNAQEAHEAIRPTNISITPNGDLGELSNDERKLYELIWKRTVASQMSSAELDTCSIDIVASDDRNCHGIFRATGSIVVFDGFYKIYLESNDDAEDDDSKMLPSMKVNDKANAEEITPAQHFTEPPPRYTEASLVKKLEELGIGRPSTYANILSVIQDRGYVTLEKKRFIPDSKGRIVTEFLKEFFLKYVEYDFTANLEEDLDKIAAGELAWKSVMHDFWNGFHTNIAAVNEKHISDIISGLEVCMQDYLFPVSHELADKISFEERKRCPQCAQDANVQEKGTLGLKLGKFGAFLACSNYPDCNYKRTVTSEPDEQGGENVGTDSVDINKQSRILGVDSNGDNILLKKGPFGFYVQLKEDEKGEKPQRASLPSGANPETITLEAAIKLLSLPKIIGDHPTLNSEMSIAIGKYGPYVKCAGKFVSIPKAYDPFTITFEEAVELVDKKFKSAK